MRSARSVLLAWCVTAAAGVASCAGPRRTAGTGALEARYLAQRHDTGHQETSTAVYRGILAKSIFSRCRMFPSDSELYDVRAAQCGAAPAAVMGISRLLLEVAASPQLMPALIADGRVRWLDLPPGDLCVP